LGPKIINIPVFALLKVTGHYVQHATMCHIKPERPKKLGGAINQNISEHRFGKKIIDSNTRKGFFKQSVT